MWLLKGSAPHVENHYSGRSQSLLSLFALLSIFTLIVSLYSLKINQSITHTHASCAHTHTPISSLQLSLVTRPSCPPYNCMSCFSVLFLSWLRPRWGQVSSTRLMEKSLQWVMRKSAMAPLGGPSRPLRSDSYACSFNPCP